MLLNIFLCKLPAHHKKMSISNWEKKMNISKAMVQEQFLLERVHHVGEEEHLEQFGSPKTPWKKLGVPSCKGETVVH